MAHDSTSTPVPQAHPGETAQDRPAAAEKERCAPPGRPVEQGPPVIDPDGNADEDYAEFLQTQHFFNDTAAYSSQGPQSPSAAHPVAEEMFGPNVSPDAPSEEPEPETPPDLFELAQMFRAPPDSIPTPAEDAGLPDDQEALFLELTPLDESENPRNTPFPHELRDMPVIHRQRAGDEQVDWKIGDIIDARYEVKDILGRGGMGVVYRVHHREWDLDMAVKMPLLHLVANQVLKSRFVQEAQTWINLGLHPNIVQCWYVREFGGIPRVFMDYVAGGSLKEWIAHGRIQPGSWERILDLTIQACDGLGYAHEHGIKAHRDVKPGNFLLTEEGDLRVTDFGIAKRADYDDGEEQQQRQIEAFAEGQRQAVTMTGSDVGTPEYGAPEQWGDAKHADARADIYALGGVLFELCCGRRAFDDGQHREQPYALIGRHLFSPVPDPRAFNPDIPPALADIIARCLAKDPDERPGSMRELRESQVDLYKKIVGRPYWKEVPQAAELRSSTLNNRAVSLLDLGKTAEALAALDDALKLDPHHAESVYNRALLEWRNERIADDEVVRRLKEARQVNRRAGAYLGLIHLERGAVEEAEQAVTEALELPELRQESLVWRILGDALMAQEKYDLALHAYQQALDVLPGDTELEYRQTLARQSVQTHEPQHLFPYPHCIRMFPGGTERLDNLMLSPDAAYAFAVSAENAKLWNLATGKYLWTYTWSDEGRGLWTCKGYAGSRACAVITPDAEFAFAGSADDRLIGVWSLKTGQYLTPFEGHAGEVSALAILSEGRRLLSGSLDATLRLWDIPSGQCLRVFEGPQEPITALAVTPDGQYAFFGSAQVIRQLDLDSGRIVRTFRGHGDDVTALIIDHRRQLLVSGSRDKTVRVWTLTSGRCVHALTGHTDGVTALDLAPDGAFAISAGLDKHLRLWDLTQGTCAHILQGHASHITGVRITPDGRFAFSVSRDRTLRLWRPDTGQCLRVFPEFTHWLDMLTLTPDGQYALLGNAAEMRLKHLPSQTYRQTLTRHAAADRHPATSDRLEKVAPLHNLPPGENFLTIMGRDEDTTFAIATPSGNIGISAGPQETLYAWDVQAEHKRRLWGMRGLRGLQIFKGYRSLLRTLATTPDGKLAVTGGEDGHAHLWELPAATRVRTFEGPRGSLYAVALTPDAGLVLTGSIDGTIRLWERESGACAKVLTGHADAVTALAMTPDGQFAVSGSSDNTLRIWNLTTGKCLRTFAEHDDTIMAVAITPDAQYALSATNGRVLRLWRLDARVPGQAAVFQVCRHVGHRELEIFRKRFQRFLARADDFRKAGNIATSYTFLTLARSIPGYERDPAALALNAVLSDRLIKKRLRGGRLLYALPGHERAIMAAAATNDGRFVVTGGYDKTLRLWGLGTGRYLRTCAGHADHIISIAVTPDRHLAATGSRDRTVRLWALATGECLKVLTGHEDDVTAVVVSADNRLVVSGSRDKTIRLWPLMTDEQAAVFDGMQRSVEDAYQVAERMPDRSLRVLKGHAEAVEAVAIAADSRTIMSASQDLTLRLWNVATGRCLRIFRGHAGYVTAVALSENGRFAVSASRDHTLRVWRVATGGCVRTLHGHEGYVSSVAVTSDGQFAVSGSWDRTVRLWNLTTGACLWVFERHDGEVEAITITPDGHFAVSGGRDATLRVWEFDWELSPKKIR